MEMLIEGFRSQIKCLAKTVELKIFEPHTGYHPLKKATNYGQRSGRLPAFFDGAVDGAWSWNRGCDPLLQVHLLV